jgi:uncharacterized protein (DUF2236 family)
MGATGPGAARRVGTALREPLHRLGSMARTRPELDLGIFGPGSMAWRVHREPAGLVGGIRALMIQALHPLAMAGVAQHSAYRSDVWGRFDRSSRYVLETVFGDTETALEAGRRVRAVHRSVRGTDPVTGLRYSADDPELLLWVHCVLVDSFLASHRRFVGPLSDAEGDRYAAEMVRQAELVGLEAAAVPATEGAVRAFIEACGPSLLVTPAAREGVTTLLRPPLPAHRRPGWWITVSAAISIMPARHRELYGLRRTPLSPGVRLAVSTGSALARRWGRPPPVLAEARARAAAAGASL